MLRSSRLGARFPLWIRVQQTLAIAEFDLRKLRHDPYELFTRMIQPAMWLLIFGQAMAKIKAIPTGDLSYLSFIAPGILAQSVLFISIFYGIALIWERDMGVLHKILVSPASRTSLVIGRSVAAGVRGLSQMIIIYVLALFLGVQIRWSATALIGVVAVVMLEGAIFSTVSLIVASVVKRRERFMGIGQVLTMPLFFASNALYPIELMPGWLQTLSVLNPLTYLVDALRHLMIEGAPSHFGLWTDFGVGIGVWAVLLVLATRLYPRILY